MNSTNARRLYNIADAVLLAFVAGWVIRDFRMQWLSRPAFDDAYMFARYATNIRHGLGISWNGDGLHTYGQTSLMWCGVVTLLSFLPVGVGKMLILGSRLSSIGALIAIAWAVAANAESDLFASTWRVLPWVVVPLAKTSVFNENAGNGMETLLAALLCAVFVGLSLKWYRGAVRPEWVGCVGVLLFITRPEAAIVAVLLPVMLFFVTPGLRKENLARLLGVLFAGVLLDLVTCKLYFHTALPLSFYMKGWRGYRGYVFLPDWYPELRMMAFLAACQLYLAAIIFLARREDWRWLICTITPLVVVFAYLQTVLQVTGGSARYYAPYLALVVVPALLLVDRWINSWTKSEPDVRRENNAADKTVWPGKSLPVRSCVAGLMMLCFVALSMEGTGQRIRRVENKTHYAYDPVQLDVAAKTSLPTLPWLMVLHDVSDMLVAPLPKGATVAATEVGYLASSAPQVNIIDVSGLNDAEMALHGFDPDDLLARHPDVIWMPHEAYTYRRGRIMSDPELLREYDFYAGAGNFGLAIRKDSPFHAEIEQQLQVFWDSVYPGYPMSNYLVKAASWSGREYVISDEQAGL